jgi:hypothetical protein
LDEPPEPPIPSYMSQAIWVTLLCFPITGFWAIVQASKVIALLDEGDRAGALVASRKARWWVKVSAIVGLVIYLATAALIVSGYMYIYNVILPRIERGQDIF